MKKDIEGISRIGFIEDYEIYIKTDDEVCIPHFHIRNRSNISDFNTSVCIEKTEYCFHNNKENELSADTKIKLQEFMQQSVPFANGDLSFWECVCIAWNSNNPDSYIIERCSQPDYTMLNCNTR